MPLSIIFDDSTVLVNLNYFFLRDRTIAEGRPQRWEDLPVVHPASFTREFAEWCLASGVRGKFSVVPCPAALGRIDEGLPLFSQAQQDEWLAMCREVIVPAFDITPEMLTHTFVLDPQNLAAAALQNMGAIRLGRAARRPRGISHRVHRPSVSHSCRRGPDRPKE